MLLDCQNDDDWRENYDCDCSTVVCICLIVPMDRGEPSSSHTEMEGQQ